MKPNTCLVLDVWEGQLEIDEAILKANGVAGIGIRLNDMSGGHHMDAGFTKQWAEAANFVRFPYFVYNPWVDGAANYAWLTSHMPDGVKCLAIDIEVKFSGITPLKYASDVDQFLALCHQHGWKTIIYTAEWFLASLSRWPQLDYWWAQYPDAAAYFSGVTTWDELRLRLDKLGKPFNAAKVPGRLMMWQFSGDYLLLPGNNRDMDVNLFYGTEQELADYFGAPGTIAEPPPVVVVVPVDAVTVTAASGLNVRSGPGMAAPKIGAIARGTQVVILEYRRLSAVEVWGRISQGWIALLLAGECYTSRADFGGIPDVPVSDPLFPHIYRIKDDLEAGMSPGGTRPYLRNGLPSTVRLRGGESQYLLSAAWIAYLKRINSPKSYDYLIKPASGWHNAGVSNLMQQLTFSGNHVEVLRIEGNQAFIKTYFLNDPPPSGIIQPTEKTLHPQVQLFTTQYKRSLDMSTNGRYPRTLLLANPGEEIWINLRDIVRL